MRAGRLFTGASVAAVLYLQAVLRTCGYYVRAEIDGFPVDTSALVTGGLQAIVLQLLLGSLQMLDVRHKFLLAIQRQA